MSDDGSTAARSTTEPSTPETTTKIATALGFTDQNIAALGNWGVQTAGHIVDGFVQAIPTVLGNVTAPGQAGGVVTILVDRFTGDISHGIQGLEDVANGGLNTFVQDAVSWVDAIIFPGNGLVGVVNNLRDAASAFLGNSASNTGSPTTANSQVLNPQTLITAAAQ